MNKLNPIQRPVEEKPIPQEPKPPAKLNPFGETNAPNQVNDPKGV